MLNKKDSLDINIWKKERKSEKNISTKIELFSSLNIPKIVKKYLQNKHKTIINNYRTPDNKHMESCSYIAFSIAKLLIEAWKHPYIISIKKDLEDWWFDELYPLMYNKKVLRYTHIVCCCDDMIYDPILNDLVKKNQYCTIVFWENLPMEITHNPEEIKDIISKIKI